MAHGKDPAWSFYSSDYLLDPDVLAIDPAHEGALVRMWSVLWLHGPMPIDRLRTFAPMLRCKPCLVDELAERFLVRDKAGNLFSERMEAERSERAERRDKLRESGRRGGKATAAKRSGRQPSGDKPGRKGRCSKATSDAAPTHGAASLKPSVSVPVPEGNPSDVSRTPDPDPHDPSAPHPPTNANGVPGGSERRLDGCRTEPVSQEARESPVTASRGEKVPTHHPPRELATGSRTGASESKRGSQHGPQPASDLIGGAMRLLGGGAA